MTPREVEDFIVTSCIDFTEEMMRSEHDKEITRRHRDVIKVAVEFVQTLDIYKLICMPQPREVDEDMKLVIAYAVIRMGRLHVAHTYKQYRCMNIIMRWHKPEALETIKEIARV